jgi:hypothetical protein
LAGLSSAAAAHLSRIPLTSPCAIRYRRRHMAPRKPASATKKDLHLLEQRLLASSVKQKEQIMRHFDVAVEAIRGDLLGANADRIELLHDRITRVEQRVGLAPA